MPPADRIYSSDTAFKPTNDGWGYTRKFVSNYDKIFSKSGQKSEMQQGMSQHSNHILDCFNKLDDAEQRKLLAILNQKHGEV